MVYKLTEAQIKYVTWLRDNVLTLPYPYYTDDDKMMALKGSMDVIHSTGQYDTHGRMILQNIGEHYANPYRAYLRYTQKLKTLESVGNMFDVMESFDEYADELPESVRTTLKTYIELLRRR